jgi:hypothetical protein
MNVVDDLANLRASYSGFLQWFHGFALILFLWPYIWFIAQQWAFSHWANKLPGRSIPLWEAFLKFIASGGRSWNHNWQFAFIPLSLFFITFAYNLLRAILLWKTKSLEFDQDIRGLPSRFSFQSEKGWHRAYKASKWLFIGNLVALVGHTLWFLQLRIPVGP